MDLTYTGEQQALRDALTRYLDKEYAFDKRQQLLRSGAPWSREVWSQLAEFGLVALPFSEHVGGLGGSVVDVVAASEILGEHLCIEPYAATVLAGGALEAALKSGGEHSELASLLERLVAADVVVAFAHEEGHGTPAARDVTLVASESGGRYTLSGAKELVLGAGQAEAFVVTARTPAGDLALFLVRTDQSQVRVREYRTIDGRAAGAVSFEQAQAELILTDPRGEVIDSIIGTAVIGLAAEAVGCMGALLRQTVDYASTRQQFGVPIGSFQVLAHRMADMKLAYTKARATLLYTAALAEVGRASATEVSVLAAQVGRLGREIGESAVQIHGGIGTTDELAIGHLYKRILAVEVMFGGTDVHLRVVGSAYSTPVR
ncbi:pilus assembly protein CpaB [Epidermidibacterium keratini]|uniref:Pilus assembly protein CpaB n=1 Tax=Epidermidibacterium keratini TaxID=1891644 RepID=A0A7L4YL28_9ACTN|nr:acyl-CoA dehydrogenase family protein [Epidermidibacterium keratini]QHB99582.1 pilus assembly protein CpaB [Epidermidibacterium keratini]